MSERPSKRTRNPGELDTAVSRQRASPVPARRRASVPPLDATRLRAPRGDTLTLTSRMSAGDTSIAGTSTASRCCGPLSKSTVHCRQLRWAIGFVDQPMATIPLGRQARASHDQQSPGDAGQATRRDREHSGSWERPGADLGAKRSRRSEFDDRQNRLTANLLRGPARHDQRCFRRQVARNCYAPSTGPRCSRGARKSGCPGRP